MSSAPWHGAARSIRAAAQNSKTMVLRLSWLAAALALLLSTQAVRAHALLVHADPQPNAELTLLNLNSELDKGRQGSHIFVREMERRLLGLPSVGNQTGDEIDDSLLENFGCGTSILPAW